MRVPRECHQLSPALLPAWEHLAKGSMATMCRRPRNVLQQEDLVSCAWETRKAATNRVRGSQLTYRPDPALRLPCCLGRHSHHPASRLLTPANTTKPLHSSRLRLDFDQCPSRRHRGALRMSCIRVPWPRRCPSQEEPGSHGGVVRVVSSMALACYLALRLPWLRPYVHQL